MIMSRALDGGHFYKYRDIINAKIHHRRRNDHSAETAACTKL